MIKLLFTGGSVSRYRGLDPETNLSMDLGPGESVEVSERKSRQLLADYPGSWRLIEETQEDAPVSRPPSPSGKKPRKNKAMKPARDKGY